MDKITIEQRAAMYAENLNGDKVALPMAEYPSLLSYIVEGKLSKLFGTDVQPADVNAGGIIFKKNQGQTESAKTMIGLNLSDIEKAKIDTKYFLWNDSSKFAVGFDKYDLELGLINSAAIKSEKNENTHVLANERKIFAGIVDYIKTNNPTHNIVKDLLDDSVTPQEVYDEFENLGHKIAQTIDANDGIDQVDPSKIILQGSLAAISKAAKTGLMGDRTTVTFAGGAYSVFTIGGYKVAANNFLPAGTHILAGTDFCWPTATKYIANNIDRLAPTNDMCLFQQFGEIDGCLYPSVLYTVGNE